MTYLRPTTPSGASSPAQCHAASAIRQWCHDSIEFVPDPPGVELLYTPGYLAECALGLHPQGRILSREYIGDDDAGRVKTLMRMRRLVAHGCRDRHVRALACSVVTGRPVHGVRLAVDCDDVATLAGSMARACGLSVQFRAIAFIDFRRSYGHVYVEITDRGGALMIDVDITREAQGAPPSWYVTRQIVVPA